MTSKFGPAASLDLDVPVDANASNGQKLKKKITRQFTIAPDKQVDPQIASVGSSLSSVSKNAHIKKELFDAMDFQDQSLAHIARA